MKKENALFLAGLSVGLVATTAILSEKTSCCKGCCSDKVCCKECLCSCKSKKCGNPCQNCSCCFVG